MPLPAQWRTVKPATVFTLPRSTETNSVHSAARAATSKTEKLAVLSSDTAETASAEEAAGTRKLVSVYEEVTVPSTTAESLLPETGCSLTVTGAELEILTVTETSEVEEARVMASEARPPTAGMPTNVSVLASVAAVAPATLQRPLAQAPVSTLSDA